MSHDIVVMGIYCWCNF